MFGFCAFKRNLVESNKHHGYFLKINLIPLLVHLLNNFCKSFEYKCDPGLCTHPPEDIFEIKASDCFITSGFIL